MVYNATFSMGDSKGHAEARADGKPPSNQSGKGSSTEKGGVSGSKAFKQGLEETKHITRGIGDEAINYLAWDGKLAISIATEMEAIGLTAGTYSAGTFEPIDADFFIETKAGKTTLYLTEQQSDDIKNGIIVNPNGNVASELKDRLSAVLNGTRGGSFSRKKQQAIEEILGDYGLSIYNAEGEKLHIAQSGGNTHFAKDKLQIRPRDVRKFIQMSNPQAGLESVVNNFYDVSGIESESLLTPKKQKQLAELIEKSLNHRFGAVEAKDLLSDADLKGNLKSALKTLDEKLAQKTPERVIGEPKPYVKKLRETRKKSRLYNLLTYKASKDLSVYYAATGDERIEEAVKEAAETMMHKLEDIVEKRLNNKKDLMFNPRGREKTGQMLWMNSFHKTSGRTEDRVFENQSEAEKSFSKSEIEALQIKTIGEAKEYAKISGSPHLAEQYAKAVDDGRIILRGRAAPDLHMHYFAANLTQNQEEDIWHALEASNLSSEEWHGIWNLELANSLKKRGFENLQMKKGGVIGFREFNDEIVQLMSPRSREINEFKDGFQAKYSTVIDKSALKYVGKWTRPNNKEKSHYQSWDEVASQTKDLLKGEFAAVYDAIVQIERNANDALSDGIADIAPKKRLETASGIVQVAIKEVFGDGGVDLSNSTSARVKKLAAGLSLNSYVSGEEIIFDQSGDIPAGLEAVIFTEEEINAAVKENILSVKEALKIINEDPELQEQGDKYKLVEFEANGRQRLTTLREFAREHELWGNYDNVRMSASSTKYKDTAIIDDYEIADVPFDHKNIEKIETAILQNKTIKSLGISEDSIANMGNAIAELLADRKSLSEVQPGRISKNSPLIDEIIRFSSEESIASKESDDARLIDQYVYEIIADVRREIKKSLPQDLALKSEWDELVNTVRMAAERLEDKDKLIDQKFLPASLLRHKTKLIDEAKGFYGEKEAETRVNAIIDKIQRYHDTGRKNKESYNKGHNLFNQLKVNLAEDVFFKELNFSIRRNAGFTFDDDQKKFLEDFLNNSTYRTWFLNAKPGTGKTTSMAEVKRAIEEPDKAVLNKYTQKPRVAIGVVAQHTAGDELRERGFEGNKKLLTLNETLEEIGGGAKKAAYEKYYNKHGITDNITIQKLLILAKTAKIFNKYEEFSEEQLARLGGEERKEYEDLRNQNGGKWEKFAKSQLEALKGNIIIADEMSLLTMNQMNGLLKLQEKYDFNLLMVGDENQQTSTDTARRKAVSPVKILLEKTRAEYYKTDSSIPINISELEDNKRVAIGYETQREIASKFAIGDIEGALKLAQKVGSLEAGLGKDETFDDILERSTTHATMMAAAGEKLAITTLDHKTGRAAWESFREKRKDIESSFEGKMGRIGKLDVKLTVHERAKFEEENDFGKIRRDWKPSDMVKITNWLTDGDLVRVANETVGRNQRSSNWGTKTFITADELKIDVSSLAVNVKNKITTMDDRDKEFLARQGAQLNPATTKNIVSGGNGKIMGMEVYYANERINQTSLKTIPAGLDLGKSYLLLANENGEVGKISLQSLQNGNAEMKQERKIEFSAGEEVFFTQSTIDARDIPLRKSGAKANQTAKEVRNGSTYRIREFVVLRNGDEVGEKKAGTRLDNNAFRTLSEDEASKIIDGKFGSQTVYMRMDNINEPAKRKGDPAVVMSLSNKNMRWGYGISQTRQGQTNKGWKDTDNDVTEEISSGEKVDRVGKVVTGTEVVIIPKHVPVDSTNLAVLGSRHGKNVFMYIEDEMNTFIHKVLKNNRSSASISDKPEVREADIINTLRENLSIAGKGKDIPKLEDLVIEMTSGKNDITVREYIRTLKSLQKEQNQRLNKLMTAKTAFATATGDVGSVSGSKGIETVIDEIKQRIRESISGKQIRSKDKTLLVNQQIEKLTRGTNLAIERISSTTKILGKVLDVRRKYAESETMTSAVARDIIESSIAEHGIAA